MVEWLKIALWSDFWHTTIIPAEDTRMLCRELIRSTDVSKESQAAIEVSPNSIK